MHWYHVEVPHVDALRDFLSEPGIQIYDIESIITDHYNDDHDYSDHDLCVIGTCHGTHTGPSDDFQYQAWTLFPPSKSVSARHDVIPLCLASDSDRSMSAAWLAVAAGDLTEQPEQVFAADGVFEEIFAIDYTEGLAHDVTEENEGASLVVEQCLQHLWELLQPSLKPLIDHAFLKASQSAGYNSNLAPFDDFSEWMSDDVQVLSLDDSVGSDSMSFSSASNGAIATIREFAQHRHAHEQVVRPQVWKQNSAQTINYADGPSSLVEEEEESDRDSNEDKHLHHHQYHQKSHGNDHHDHHSHHDHHDHGMLLHTVDVLGQANLSTNRDLSTSQPTHALNLSLRPPTKSYPQPSPLPSRQKKPVKMTKTLRRDSQGRLRARTSPNSLVTKPKSLQPIVPARRNFAPSRIKQTPDAVSKQVYKEKSFIPAPLPRGGTIAAQQSRLRARTASWEGQTIQQVRCCPFSSVSLYTYFSFVSFVRSLSVCVCICG